MGNIAFITELPFNDNVSRDYPHMRTEFAQMCALKADHYNYKHISSIKQTYNHIILLISKSDSIRDWLYNTPDLVDNLRLVGKKIWFMQEATAQIYHQFELHHQIRHYNLLQEVDGILTENKTDYNYFKGIVGSTKDIYTIPTLIIPDNFFKLRTVERKNKTMVGGNFTKWYAGFDSYLVASEFNNHISIPKMRTVKNESDFVEILPHIQFNQWMYKLSEYKYGVHLMPNITAGTFNLNCSFLGIPCIGYIDSDTQRICQPSLSVDKYDLQSAINMAKMLKEDKEFYNHCSKEAIQNHDKYFSESVFLDYMNNTVLKSN
jgi:hypothetical protein